MQETLLEILHRNHILLFLILMMHGTPTGIAASVALLTLIIALSGIVVLALLWKNPVTLHLLSVQLKYD